MKKMTVAAAVVLSAAVAFSAPISVNAAQDAATKSDNAKKNKEGGVTAEQQKENKSDREITREIRRAVVKDKSLSVKAHNVKIITEGGQVTLKGPVKTEEEKTAVEKAAADVVGKGKVTNQLEVAPPKEKKVKKEKKEEKKEEKK